AIAVTGPRAAKTRANTDPVSSQMATESTTGARTATIGKRHGTGGVGATGRAMRAVVTAPPWASGSASAAHTTGRGEGGGGRGPGGERGWECPVGPGDRGGAARPDEDLSGGC